MTRSQTAALALEAPSVEPVREFTFSDTDFAELSRYAYDTAGIVLSDAKRNLLYGRVSRRLRALGLTRFSDYRRVLVDDAVETEKFINAISTNLTRFFRESHHFDHFRNHVAVPHAHASLAGRGGRLRVWSAGCSTGEEAYSIAIVLRREIVNVENNDIRVLATDIDTEVVSKGEQGRYPPAALEDVPKIYREFFEPAGDQVDVRESVRSLVSFRRLNLIEPWPFSGLFDAIFCRNVMIYFDTETKHALVTRFMRQLRPGGWLYIGHSESLGRPHPGLRLIGRTIYRREG